MENDRPVHHFWFGGLYLVNISRIAALSIGLYKVPQYGTILHELVFPAVLYGVTWFMDLLVKKYAPNHSRMKLRISKLILPFILFAFYRQTESWFYEPLGNYYHFSAAKCQRCTI